MSRRLRSLLSLGLTASAVFASACMSPTAPYAAPPSPAQEMASAPDAAPHPPVPFRQAGPFDAQVLEIARIYRQQFTRVSDHAHWAPEDCRAPIPGGVLESASGDSTTHGKKLYFLFAKDARDYALSGNTLRYPRDTTTQTPWKAAIGQALVKQSFVPVMVPAGDESLLIANDAEQRENAPEYVRGDDGTFYRTGEPAALFIMLKLDPATRDTDEGWVYATTTSDGRSVLDAGRIGSCIQCHEQTTRDRLYGPQWSWPVDR